MDADAGVGSAGEPVDVVWPEVEDPAGRNDRLDAVVTECKVVLDQFSRTTATAPDERSWSCQPVSLSGVQHNSHTST